MTLQQLRDLIAETFSQQLAYYGLGLDRDILTDCASQTAMVLADTLAEPKPAPEPRVSVDVEQMWSYAP